MAHFARIDDNNIVVRVHVVENKDLLNEQGVEEEAVGIAHLTKVHGTGFTWIQTSYNTQQGVHVLGGTPLRKNYAGKGDTYDETRDAFIAPQPYPSWILAEDTCIWEAPTAYPEDGKIHGWNEETTSWDLLIYPKPYPSWILKEDGQQWKAPVVHPGNNRLYAWNEGTTSWDLEE